MSKAARELIKAGVYELVKEGGFGLLSTQRIAEKSNMTKGNLYNYFPDKDQIVLEAYDDIEQGLQEMINGFEHNSELSDKENLKLLWNRFYSYFEAFPDRAVFYVIFRSLPLYLDMAKDNKFGFSGVFDKSISPYIKADDIYKSAICDIVLHNTVRLLEAAIAGNRSKFDADYIFETVFRGIC